MKKRIIALLLAAAMVFSLTACSSSSDSSSSSSDSSSSSTDSSTDSTDSSTDSTGVTLTVNMWDSVQLDGGLQQMFDEFEAETGIAVEASVVTWEEYWTLLEAAASGGALADVFWMHAKESEKYMMNDILLDLSDYIDASEEIVYENYPEDLWEYYTYEDSYYAVPKDFDTMALWYNPSYFDAAGLDYPDETWTWDDLYAAAEVLNCDEYYGIALDTSGQGGWYNLIASMGGEILTQADDGSYDVHFDDPITVEAMELYSAFFTDGIAAPVTTIAETDVYTMITSGTAAMGIQGSWMLSTLKANDYAVENLAVAVLPMDSETGESYSVYNGLGWAANAGTEYPDEAWQLIEYMTNYEGQSTQAELGVTMSAYEGTLDAWVEACTEFDVSSYVDMFELVIPYPVTLSTSVWETEQQEIFSSAFAGEITIQEACEQVDEMMQTTIDEQG